MSDPVKFSMFQASSPNLRLQGRSQDQPENDRDRSLRKAARQFEALFTQMMLKQMRQAVPKGGLFDSNQGKLYQEMFDQKVAGSLSERSGLGLADLLIRQLGQQSGARPNPMAVEPEASAPMPASRSEKDSPVRGSLHGRGEG